MRDDDKLIRSLDLVDDDLIERAAPGAYRKKAKRSNWLQSHWLRVAVAACLVLGVLSGTLAAVLGGSQDPTVSPAPGIDVVEDYSRIASKLQLMSTDDVTAFNSLFPPMSPPALEDDSTGAGEDDPPSREEDDTNTAHPSGGSEEMIIQGVYQEVTYNQVEGMTEPDIFQRTDTHLFYLNRGSLLVYSIAGENSELVGEYSRATDAEEFFLSADGKRLTLISSGSADVTVNILDVSDPANITELSTFRATGRYYSARLVNGKLMLLMGNSIIGQPDYNDVTTFVPRYDTGNGLQTLSATDIYYPEKLNSSNYTVIYQLNGQTLTPEDSTALLSYSGRILVWGSDIFVTRPYVEYRQTEGGTTAHAMLEIARVSYADGTLTYGGAVSVEGVMKDQDSMNVYNGTLRVVTTTREVYWESKDEAQTGNRINTGLFCIDVAGMQVIAKEVNFAPEGEAVRSVCFDGTKVYVATAIIATRDDPVFCFDLSDLAQITHTDTSEIPGYASSLIELGDGYLLGVDKGEDGLLKVEVYDTESGAVTPVCQYTRTALFSKDPKSYFIDREKGLIGLVVDNINDANGPEYILLHFDGTQLKPLICESINGFYEGARSILIDGYVYVLSWSLSVFPLELS